MKHRLIPACFLFLSALALSPLLVRAQDPDSSACRARKPHWKEVQDLEAIESLFPKPFVIPDSCQREDEHPCYMYDCAENEVQSRGFCQEGEPHYFSDYGLKYCRKFSTVTRPKLTEEGQAWLDRALVCLKDAIFDHCKDGGCDSCTKIDSLAFRSHAPCYINSGLCSLPLSDWKKITMTVETRDLVSRASRRQILQAGSLCVSQFVSGCVKCVKGVCDTISTSCGRKKGGIVSVDNPDGSGTKLR